MSAHDCTLEFEATFKESITIQQVQDALSDLTRFLGVDLLEDSAEIEFTRDGDQAKQLCFYDARDQDASRYREVVNNSMTRLSPLLADAVKAVFSDHDEPDLAESVAVFYAGPTERVRQHVIDEAVDAAITAVVGSGVPVDTEFSALMERRVREALAGKLGASPDNQPTQWTLVPATPTPEMYAAMGAYDGRMYSDPFTYEDFLQDYAAMLQAAPSAQEQPASEQSSARPTQKG